MSKQYQQINFADVNQQVQTTLKDNIPAVTSYWSGYAAHEQAALIDWALRKNAGKKIEKWRVAVAAANKYHRGHRPQPSDAKAVTPNKPEHQKNWEKDEPILHDLILAASQKLRRHRVDGYAVYDSVLVPHVVTRGSKKGRHIAQPFGLQHRTGFLGHRDKIMLVTLLTICVGREEGNELITSPAELRHNRRIKYKNRELHDSMWAAITALLEAGYLCEADPITDRKWRIVIDRDLLQSWLIDHRDNHAYQVVKADEFYKRARSPLRLWMYLAYQTTYNYTGKDEQTVREASGSRATPQNFRRALRNLFRHYAMAAAHKKTRSTEVVDQNIQQQTEIEIKKLTTKAARSVWLRNDVGNDGSSWQLNVVYWIHKIKRIDELVMDAINAVAERLFGDPLLVEVE